MGVSNADITTVEMLYTHLNRYIKWLSYRHANMHNVMLQPDELEGELLFELVKGWMYYQQKGLSSPDLLKVIKRMLTNRIAELKYRFYCTHRHAELGAVELDSLVDSLGDSTMDPESRFDSSSRVHAFMNYLTPFELSLVLYLLQPDRRLGQQIKLLGYRKTFVYKQPTITLGPDMVAKALHFDVQVVRSAWRAVKQKWNSMYDSDSEGGWCMANTMTKDIAKAYGKAALLEVARELEIDDIKQATHIYKLVEAIDTNVRSEGVPEPEEASDDLFSLMIDMGFIDGDGNILDEDESDESEQEPSEPTKTKGVKPKKKEAPELRPGCWGTGDPEDPSCKKCSKREECIEVRIDNRANMSCFGKRFDTDSEDCKICLEWDACREAMP